MLGQWEAKNQGYGTYNSNLQSHNADRMKTDSDCLCSTRSRTQDAQGVSTCQR